ncbi:hypothetical protein L9F63_026940, partial [Diploptera punctata]
NSHMDIVNLVLVTLTSNFVTCIISIYFLNCNVFNLRYRMFLNIMILFSSNILIFPFGFISFWAIA